MSELNSAIHMLFYHQRTNQYRLADTTSLKFEQIQNWLDHPYLMDQKDLIRLARAFRLKQADYEVAHARLLFGYLKDRCHGPGAKLIHMELLPKPDWIQTSEGIVSLSQSRVRDAKTVLDAMSYSKEIRAKIRELAKLYLSTKDNPDQPTT